MFVARLPIRAAFAGATRRAPASFARYNSSATSSARARMVEMASQAEKPSIAEGSIPVMWAVCGALVYTAFNRIEEKAGSENVQTLLIV